MRSDPRFSKLSQIIVGHSTKVRPGENVLLSLSGFDGYPLFLEVYQEAIKAGANVATSFGNDDLTKAFYKYASTRQLKTPKEAYDKLLDWARVRIAVVTVGNDYELSKVPAEKMKMVGLANKNILEKAIEKIRWCLVYAPSRELALKAKMGLDEVYGFYFATTNLDWKRLAQKYQPIIQKFQAAESVRLVGPQTDLTFSTRGRKYVPAFGQCNLPDGEFFTAPIEDSTSGHITFEWPQNKYGFEVEEPYFEFKNGRAVVIKAKTNQEKLRKILTTDPSASLLGEFGVGVNFGIKRPLGEIIFDEKIGGSIHLAFGKAYKECLGKNESAIHWDFIKDLRKDGEIYLDGKLAFRNGKFL